MPAASGCASGWSWISGQKAHGNGDTRTESAWHGHVRMPVSRLDGLLRARLELHRGEELLERRLLLPDGVGGADDLEEPEPVLAGERDHHSPSGLAVLDRAAE